MEIAYTYWEADDGLFVGYLNDYPDHLTQGHDLAELEDMLADLYRIRQEEEKRLLQKRKTGVPRIKIPALNGSGKYPGFFRNRYFQLNPAPCLPFEKP